MCHGSNVVGVSECVLFRFVAQLLQIALNDTDLIGGVCLSGAVQQSNLLGIREQFLDHGCLTIQGSQVAGAGNIQLSVALPIADIKRSAVVGNGSAENRDISSSADRRLQGRRSIGHNQVNTGRNEAVRNGSTGSRIAGGILLIKNNPIAQLFGQRIPEALGGGIQCGVLYQLNNAYRVGLLFFSAGTGKTSECKA